MFWLITAAVLVVGFAVAWWTSGRARNGVSGSAYARNRGAIDGNLSAQHDPSRSGPGAVGLGGGGGI